MQVSLESVSELERRMTVQIPADKIDGEVNKRIIKISKTAKLDGFRPGKAPRNIIEKRFGASVRHEVLGEVISSSLHEALVQEHVHPASQPMIDEINEKPGDGVEFKAVFEVFPKIELKGFEGIKVEKPLAEIVDGDINEAVERAQKQRSEWTSVEREAKEGDQVVINFSGTVDGTLSEKASAEDYALELGSNTFIKGFESALIGIKSGENKQIELTFPEDYHSKDFAGKPVVFDVTIKDVKASSLPELNDEFFAYYGIKEGGIDAFKDMIRGHMERELKTIVKNRQKESVFEQLIALHEVTVPNALVAEEEKRLRDGMQKQMGQHQSGELELDDEQTDALKERAVKNVTLGLLLQEVIKQRKLKADPERVREYIEEQAKLFGDPEPILKWYEDNPQYKKEFQIQALEDQLVDLILEDAEVNEKNYSYKELVNT